MDDTSCFETSLLPSVSILHCSAPRTRSRTILNRSLSSAQWRLTMDKTGGKSARWMTSTGKNKLTKSDPRPTPAWKLNDHRYCCSCILTKVLSLALDRSTARSPFGSYMSNETVPPGQDIHPFLRGNFAPVASEFISHPCDVVHGEIPAELLGGQYIRNGGNPVYPPEKGRHYHW